jgi:alginate O-acetyltransferase complex protein AlgI
MLFNSMAFLVYLPAVFIAYWFLTGRNTERQNLLLLLASYLFYGWWDWRFLFLLVFSTGLDFYTGLRIRDAATPRASRIWLWISVGANLGFLGFFKYYNFFIESMADLLAKAGLETNPWTLHIILPVGISFYTFHGLSYVIDIYYKRIEPSRNWLNYCVFVSFFPLLVAGPIERATHLLPQIERPRTFRFDQAVDGLRLMLWGFFKKVFIADRLAPEVNEIFQGYEGFAGGTLLLGAVYFAIQIYGDFSGYSDIARGTSKLFGIELLVNFRFPYLSRSIPEFWRRWHISLSSWFRDYIYIPLGGSRTSFAKSVRNVFVIFLVSGFWHGANWTFIAWGAIHALLFIPSFLAGRNRSYVGDGFATGRWYPSWGEALRMTGTFLLVCLAWVFFRAPDMQTAVGYIAHMFSDITHIDGYYARTSLNLLIPAMFAIDIVQRNGFDTGRYRTWYVAAEAVTLTCIMLIGGNFGSVEFIYFQF